MDYSVVLVFEMYLGQITDSSEPEMTLTRAFSLPYAPFVGLTVNFPKKTRPRGTIRRRCGRRSAAA